MNNERCLLIRRNKTRHSSSQLGDSKPETTLSAADLAALTVTCQAILNLDATIYER